MSLFEELKRRNVFKVGTAYLVLAWVVIQVTAEAVPALHLPEWVNSLVFFLGAIGFPFVLLFAWAFELTPEGIKLESEIDRSESITQETGKSLNTLIISLLVVALAYFIYESRFSDRTQTVTSDTVVIDSAEETKQTKTLDTNKNSTTTIAVLPFVNMSKDPDQEYFSDGISEEILNVLAQLPNLQVTSRSSAFAFKGKEINLSEVAQKLGVAHVLEGSVRKDGNYVRITAQLIDAETDKHLWSETYDRELKNIFAIQDEISSSIVAALKEKLNLDLNTNLVGVTQVDLEAHEAYLKGRALVESRNIDKLRMALVEFEKAIAIEPDYANAWMGKAWALMYLAEGSYGDIPIELANERAGQAIRRALLLNPNLAESHAIEGALYLDESDREKGYKSFERAIELNPSFTNSYVWYANTLDLTKPGSIQKSLSLREKAYRLDPLNILSLNNYAISLVDFGNYEQALQISKQIRQINPESAFIYTVQTRVYGAKFELARAIRALQLAYQLSPSFGARFNLGFGLARLGLREEAANVVENTEQDILKHVFRNNFELLLTQARATLPRSDNDRFGNFYRGAVETFAGSCKQAIELFEKTYSNNHEFTIYCYRKVGDMESYEKEMSRRKDRLKFTQEAGYSKDNWKYLAMTNHYLSGEIDAMATMMKRDVESGEVIGIGFLNNPIYKQLREHKDWPAIVAISEQNRERELQKFHQLTKLGLEPDAELPSPNSPTWNN